MSQETKSRLALLIPFVALMGINLYGLPGWVFSGGVAEEVLDVRNKYTEKQLAEARFAAAHADLRKLAEEMLVAAVAAYESRVQNLFAGRASLDILSGATRRLQQAELAVLGKDADVAAVAERRWERVLEVETVITAWYKKGRTPIQDYLQAQNERLDAAIAFLRAKAEQANKDGLRFGRASPFPSVCAQCPHGRAS